MRKHAVGIERTLQIVASVLGERGDVDVTVGGTEAYTNGRSINIPAIVMDNANGLKYARGYVDHETGHVRETDFELPRSTNPLTHWIEGTLEDVRIDVSTARRYPGCRQNLVDLTELLVADGDHVTSKESDAPPAVFGNYIMSRLRADVNQEPAIRPLADATEEVAKKVFGEGFVTRLDGMIYRVQDATSTYDVLELAKAVVKLLEQEYKNTQDQLNQSQQHQGNGQQAAGGQSSSSGEPAGQGATPPQTQPGQPDPNDPGAQGASSGQPQESTQKVAQDGPSQAGNQEQQPTKEELERILQALESTLNAQSSQLPAAVADVLKDKLERLAQGNPSRAVTIATPQKQWGYAKKDLGAVKRHSIRLRSRLHALVQAARLQRYLPKRHGTQLDGRYLHRVALGDDRVFAQRRERPAVNTAVDILIDRSTSMKSANKVTIAMDAGLVAGLALESIPGVSVAVTAFPGGTDDYVLPLTQYGERVAETKDRYAIGADNFTPMAEALWFVATRLVRRPEPRKIVLVITDGQPEKHGADSSVCIAQTKDIVSRMVKSGMEVIAIGINTMHVSGLFPDSRVITDIHELPNAVLDMLRERLAQAA
jgi:cobalamin biosynthesis protein CobT